MNIHRGIIDPDNENTMPSFSSLKGNWKSALNTVIGYGVYTYPNGCRYTGYFMNGEFSGNGIFEYPEPIGITITGIFENGKLKEISNLRFSDGLTAKAKIHSNGIEFDEWGYCTSADRRFFVEHQFGILGVGGEAHLTANDPPIQLRDNTYDAGDGIFHEANYTLVNKLKNINNVPDLRHVHAKEERQWIMENCRHKAESNRYMPDRDLSREIIDINVKNQEKWQVSDYGCSCSYHTDIHKEYFGKLCETPTKFQVIRSIVMKKELETSIDSELSSNISEASSFDNAQALSRSQA